MSEKKEEVEIMNSNYIFNWDFKNIYQLN